MERLYAIDLSFANRNEIKDNKQVNYLAKWSYHFVHVHILEIYYSEKIEGWFDWYMNKVESKIREVILDKNKYKS